MKKWISIFIAAVFLLSSTLPISAVEGETDEDLQKLQKMEYVEGEALVKVTASAEKSRTRLFAGGAFEVETLVDMSEFDTLGNAGYQQEATERWDAPTLQSDYTSVQGSSESKGTITEEKILLVKSDTMSTAELIETLEQRPEVEYAEPNYILAPAELPNDTFIKKQWYLHDYNGEDYEYTGSSKAEAIWDEGSVEDSDEDAPVIAVVDTGIDYEHPDLKRMLWREGKECGEDFGDSEEKENDGPMDDLVGHGTHVAGIIGAQNNNAMGVSGMSKNVKLMALKVSDDKGRMKVSYGVKAFNYILEQKNDGVNIIAANNSWGGDAYSRTLQEMLDLLGENGVVCIVSSGNAAVNHDVTVNCPEGDFRDMHLLINASDKNGKAAYFSDYGLVSTDLYAPGVNILSTVIKTGSAIHDLEAPVWGYEMTQDPGDSIKPFAEKDSGKSSAAYISGEGKKDPHIQCTIKEPDERMAFGVEWKLGDLAEYKNSLEDIKADASHLGFSVCVEDSKYTSMARGAWIQIKGENKETGAETWLGEVGGNTANMARYGAAATNVVNLSELTTSDGEAEIDWENFTVRICTIADPKADAGNTVNFYLDKLVFVKGDTDGQVPKQPYGYQSGTSMAAPVVTGAVALLYDYYNIDGETPENQKKTLAEIRARIAGGVIRTEEMKDRCASGGYLDLKKAISSPYPVLDSLEQDGSNAAINGYFFGNSGTLEMDGKEIKTTGWNSNKITFTLPDNTSEGLHEFKITNAADPDPNDGSAQYGRDKLWTEEVNRTKVPDGTLNSEFFEALPTPDLTALGVESPLEEYSFQMAACDGKIYLTQLGLHKKDTEKTAILVYDESSGKWSVLTTDVVGLENKIYLTTDGKTLYLVENASKDEKSQISIFRMTKQASFELAGKMLQDELLNDRAIACDGSSIWLAGGKKVDPDRKVIVGDRILRFDLKTDTWIDTETKLQTPRCDALMEAVGGKLIITGGQDETGAWVADTEIIDIKTGKITKGADFPEFYADQETGAATGVYDGKMIVSGLWSDETHTADTYVYDFKEDKWEALKVRLLNGKVFLPAGSVAGDYFYVYGVAAGKDGRGYIFRRLRLNDPEPEDKPNEGKPAGGLDDSNQGKGSGIDTGDRSDILIWFTLMTAAAVAAVGGSLSRRKS